MGKREELEQYWLMQGVLDKDEIQKRIEQMANNVPEATAKEKGLVTVDDRAYETLCIMKGNQSVPAAPTQTVQTVSAPTSTATVAETAAVRMQVQDSFNEKISVGVNSAIVMYLLGRPDPHTYIAEGTQGIIDEAGWNKSIQAKIDSGQYKVMDDYTEDGQLVKSKSNYEALKTAMQNGTPVNVHIGGLGTRPVGYILKVGSAAGAGGTDEVYSRQEAQQLLTWKTNGYLGEAGGAAIRLKTVAMRTDKNNPGRSSAMKTVMVDVNKKSKLDAGAYEAIREPSSTKKTMTLKSELSFKVEDTTKMTGAQKHPTRVIRASVKCEVITLQFVPKYEKKFQKAKKDLSLPPTSEQDIVDMSNIIAAARLEATSSENAERVLMLNPNFADEVKAMRAAMQTQAPAGVKM